MSKKQRVDKLETLENERIANIDEILPLELFFKVFSYIENEELCKTVRLVSSYWKRTAESVVNRNFKLLGSKLEKEIAQRKNSLMESEGLIRKIALLNLDKFEIIYNEYRMMMIAIQRYVYVGEPLSSMFGGSIIDRIDKMINGPLPLSTNELRSIKKEMRNYIDYFELEVETEFNVNPSVSCAKLVDYLECLDDGITPAKTIEERFDESRGTYHLNRIYTIHGAWYCDYGNKQKRKSFPFKFYYMEKALKRLITNRNSFHMDTMHEARQARMFGSRLQDVRIKKFTNYEHWSHISYGISNEYDYGNLSRLFETLRNFADDPNGIDNLEDLEELVDEPNERYDSLFKLEYLEINAILACSAKFSPVNKSRDLACATDMFSLKLTLENFSSFLNRSPKKYSWSCEL